MQKLAQILEVASSKPVIQDVIMLRCRLSTKTFHDNMNLLVGSRLMEIIPTPDNPKSKRMFHTTIKGREFLNRYRNLIILLTAENMPIPHLASLCRTHEIKSLMES
jgi:predicted transcriptional regulator